MERGGISFDFEESEIEVDKKGRPVRISAHERDLASRMIEDFMLAANETIAQDYYWQDQPFLYRSHETPDPDKIRRLYYFIRNYGYYFHGRNESIHPKEFQKLLGQIAGTGEESMIARLVLRSMKRARYTAENNGHFGLAAQYYCHFTSPIRRYPDLQIHRIIKENLHGDLRAKRAEHYEKILPTVAEQTSRLERRADEAERESLRYKKCEYMEKHVGETFDGVISGVTRSGLYVELPNTVEGMIRVNELRDDYYEFLEDRWELVGEMTGRRYRLGEKIRVRCAAADRLARTVDFVPAGKEE
jgi:ribonuclease R